MIFFFYRKFLLYISLLAFSSFSSIGKEEFYIFDVGQGNSQFAVYKSGIGVLYDCGSSSSQIHHKIASLQGNQLKTFFGRKKHKLRQEILSSKSNEILVNKDDGFLQEESKEHESERKSSYSSKSLSNEDSFSLKGKEQNIKETIENHNLKHLFVILSHPDKDHINFIKKSAIPETLPVTCFLSGDWLSKGGENSKGDGLSEDVRAVLTFLKKRENTWVEFPHYWNGIKAIKTKINYTDIKEKWLLDKSDEFEETYDYCKRGTVESSICFSSLYQLLDKTLTKNHDKEKIFFDHFKTLNLDFDPNSYYYVSYVRDDLKNIKIAHLGVPFKDVNSQSSIVGMKMPSLKMQFFLTGDANEETFELINQFNNQELFFEKEKDFISLVMLPHHGSLENKSYVLFHLFKPDILAIPAGNGGMYSHPSRQLIKELEKELKEEKYQTNFYNLFEEIGLPNDFIYFYDKEISEEVGEIVESKKKKERVARLHRHKKEIEKYINIPIICTNIHGSIKIDSEGFKSLFSSSIEIDGNKSYIIDYSSRIRNNELEEKSFNLLKEKAGGEKKYSSLIFVEEKPYYGILENQSTYIYNATETTK